MALLAAARRYWGIETGRHLRLEVSAGEDRKQKQPLVRSVVLHAGQGRPLDASILALPWG